VLGINDSRQVVGEEGHFRNYLGFYNDNTSNTFITVAPPMDTAFDYSLRLRSPRHARPLPRMRRGSKKDGRRFSVTDQTLRVTAAMEAGVVDHVREIEELVALIDLLGQSRVAPGYASLW